MLLYPYLCDALYHIFVEKASFFGRNEDLGGRIICHPDKSGLRCAQLGRREHRERGVWKEDWIFVFFGCQIGVLKLYLEMVWVENYWILLN